MAVRLGVHVWQLGQVYMYGSQVRCWLGQVLVRLGKVRLGQVRLGQVSLGQVRLGQVRLGQVRLGQVRLGQARLGQVRLGQVRLGQVRLGQVRLGQVRLGSVRLGQVMSQVRSQVRQGSLGHEQVRQIKLFTISTGKKLTFSVYMSHKKVSFARQCVLSTARIQFSQD